MVCLSMRILKQHVSICFTVSFHGGFNLRTEVATLMKFLSRNLCEAWHLSHPSDYFEGISAFIAETIPPSSLHFSILLSCFVQNNHKQSIDLMRCSLGLQLQNAFRRSVGRHGNVCTKFTMLNQSIFFNFASISSSDEENGSI